MFKVPDQMFLVASLGKIHVWVGRITSTFFSFSSFQLPLVFLLIILFLLLRLMQILTFYLLLDAVGCVVGPLAETILGQAYLVTVVVATKRNERKNLNVQSGITIGICTIIIVIELTQILSSRKAN